VLPTLGGYINEGGFLHLKRFERFMETLSQYELEKFDDIYSGLFHQRKSHVKEFV
jgi:hypothetical protein